MSLKPVLDEPAIGEELTGGALIFPLLLLALGEETAERDCGENGVDGFCGEGAEASGVVGPEVEVAPKEPAGESEDCSAPVEG